MAWRYWAKEASAANGLWIDSSAQLGDVQLTWQLNGTCSGKATVPYGQYGPNTEELTGYWKRYGAALYAEEDGEVVWGGLCIAANPSSSGLDLEFAGSKGWLDGIPFNYDFQTWETPASNVADILIAYSQGFGVSTVGSVWPLSITGTLAGQVGDFQPPAKPVQPPRPKGMKISVYEDSSEYETWLALMDFWNALYANFETYKIQWWDSPYVGAEFDNVVKAVAGDYREDYGWLDVSARTVYNRITIANSILNIRQDAKFIDGINIAQRIDTKDNTKPFFQQALTLGSGEAAETHLGEYHVNDFDHYYQGYWGAFKDVYDQTTISGLAARLVSIGHNTNPIVDNIVVWDVADPSSPRVNSLRVGDVVNVVSGKTLPTLDQWCRITKITKEPETANIATLTFEVVSL